VSDKTIGVISVQVTKPTCTTQRTDCCWNCSHPRLPSAIENARLFDKAHAKAPSQFSSCMNRAGLWRSNKTPNQILNMIVERTAGLLNVPVAGIYLHDEARKDVYAAVSKDLIIFHRHPPGDGEGAAGRVAQSDKP